MLFFAFCFCHLVHPENHFISVLRDLPHSFHSCVDVDPLDGCFPVYSTNLSCFDSQVLSYILHHKSCCCEPRVLMYFHVVEVYVQGKLPQFGYWVERKSVRSFLQCDKFSFMGSCILQSHQQCLRPPISPQPRQQNRLSKDWIFAYLMNER